jgi:hypothetical protein
MVRTSPFFVPLSPSAPFRGAVSLNIGMKYAVLSTLKYLKSRLEERSTWAAIGVGVTAAAALSAPWSYIFISVAVIAAIVPTSGGTT